MIDYLLSCPCPVGSDAMDHRDNGGYIPIYFVPILIPKSGLVETLI
jgi:hypothetical protein